MNKKYSKLDLVLKWYKFYWMCKHLAEDFLTLWNMINNYVRENCQEMAFQI